MRNLGIKMDKKIKGFARKFTREKGFVGSSTTVWLAQENDACLDTNPDTDSTSHDTYSAKNIGDNVPGPS